MEEIDWLKMLAYQQELCHLSRALLPQNQKQTLTASEREILARLFLEPDKSTPLALSRSSGMKKEAVSRCIKSLFEKECIQKEKNSDDERSYMLSLTEVGRMKLLQNYGAILQPLYDLRRSMGDDFDTLFEFIRTANKNID